MIPKILHQSSRYFTWEESRLAKRAQTLMPGWKYRCWRDEHNLRLVAQICPSDVDDFLKFPNGAIRSDIARYLYMYEYGGIYFDTDFVFFTDNEDLLSHRCILGIEDEDMPGVGGCPKLGNAFIGSEPGLAVWAEFRKYFYAFPKRRNLLRLGAKGSLCVDSLS